MTETWNTAAAATIFALFMLSADVERAVAQIPDVPGWQMTWHDEFDGTSLNTTNWEALNRQDSFNDEKQYYRPEQVTVANGNLQLTATNQPLANKLYRSGLITSKTLYGPGRFEARIDLPTTQGMWPAFWLNANNVSWPLGGEIDIMENRGSQPTIVSSAYHWPRVPGQAGSSQNRNHSYTAEENGEPVDFHAGFHTYAVEWEETQLRFYVDGHLHFSLNESGNLPIFETPKNIILNLAVGGTFPGDPNTSTVFPQTMLVDYVRIWQRKTGLSGDYNGDGSVDAADYVLWRNSQGESGVGLAADGSGNGTVGDSDYLVWRQNFTSSAGSARDSATHVPEPCGTSLAAAALLRALCLRPQRCQLNP